MTPTITAFARSPDRGKGLARDMRVRWALEEVGQRYRVRLVSFSEMKAPAHRALHPFGQIPTYEEGDLALFESGAIVFRIAERHSGLLPDDAKARARAITWMFAALNTVEPPILDREFATLMERDKTWYAERLPILEDRVRVRLGELSSRLGDADWLDAAFSAGDLLMVTVLRRLTGSALCISPASQCAGQPWPGSTHSKRYPASFAREYDAPACVAWYRNRNEVRHVWAMPPAFAKYVTSSLAYRGESMRMFPLERVTTHECAPKDERALNPHRQTASVIASGKTLAPGWGCFFSLRTDAVGQTSTARQAASRSSGVLGCRANTLLPFRRAIRPGATWHAAPQSQHRVV
jgi:glutathione S-transferase